MARGWESKSAEETAEEAISSRGAQTQPKQPAPDPATAELMRKRDSLLLSRVRVMHDLEQTHNDRYRQLLSKALADLDARISTFPAH